MKRIALCFVLFAAVSAPALGPHELVLVINASSPDSIRVGETYAGMRNIPPGNVIRVKLPRGTYRETVRMSPADFAQHIWTPVTNAVRERALDSHVYAWVYSIDFPTIVTFKPPLSLQGATFLRNAGPPDKETLKRGRYVSPLYAGGDPTGSTYSPQSLERYREWLGKDMPIPSMVLGFAGTRGNSVDEIMSSLKRGLESDRTAPSGTVYFVTGKDIRSRCREWQFQPAWSELKVLGIPSQIVSNFPTERRDILGLMMGKAVVTGAGQNRYLPGCMADHLTSSAGAFQVRSQTKLSEWIRAGATTTAGAVVEPYAFWTKFPSARFFVHYASGCTVMESYFQSIRSPLEILLVGDPLACPWAPRGRIVLHGLDDAVLRRPCRLRADVDSANGARFESYMYLVDGRIAARSRFLELDPKELAAGKHTVRSVAYGSGLVRGQLFLQKTFEVKRRRDPMRPQAAPE